MLSALARYTPLLVLLSVSLAGGLALSAHAEVHFMAAFMGLGLTLFAFVKFINLPGFVKGFRKYDAFAQSLPYYAWAYPFIELILGLSYLAGTAPTLTNLALLLLAAVNTLNVTRAIGQGVNVNCACLGTALNVPLTTVTIVENGAMALMALIMLGSSL